MPDNIDVKRRAALEKMAKLSIYTAPTVITLLSASASASVGSCTNMTNLNMDRSQNFVGDGTANVPGNDRTANDMGASTALDC